MPPTLTDQVIELRTVIGKTRDELKSEIHDQGEELKTSLGEFREDFAGFRARVDVLIDDVPKTRNDFNDFRASMRTYLVVASWGIGILSTLAIGIIGSTINLAWNASRLHSDVAQHSRQIGDLTTAIQKLEERQKPLEALPEILKSMEQTAKANERLLSRLDGLENGLRPLAAIASKREWKVLMTEEDRIRDPAGAGGSDSDPFPADPNRPPDAPGRTLDYEVNLPTSSNPPKAGTLLEPVLQPLPSYLSREIEKAEAVVSENHQARIRIRFKSPESRPKFQQYLAGERHFVVDLKSGTGRE